MTLFGGGEITVGLAILVLTVLVMLLLRRRGLRVQNPSPLFLALVPVTVLIFYIAGVMLILHGAGVV